MGCWSDKLNGCQGLGSNAVGSWARNPLKRVLEDQTPQKETALLRDQIRIGGLRAELWLGLHDKEGYSRCSCYKKASQQADRKCASCHGIGYVPGYLKWGYTTYWMSATDPGVTFTNTEVTKTFKSSKVQLTSSSLSGTIESADFIFDRSVTGAVWETDVVQFIRVEGSSDVVVEYSLDAGTNWSDISTLATVNPASGSVRFRATLTRTSANVRSPLFEMASARYSRIPLGTDYNPITDSVRTGPWILVMSTVPEQQYIKSERGDLPQHGNTSFWTSGLSMFDPDVSPNTPEEMLTGPNVVIGFLDGALKGKKYITTSWSFSDPMGFNLTSQSFKIRIADDAGPYQLLW